MKIEKVNIDSIKVYPNNAKIHTAEQIEEIKKSIQEFGNNDPIAIDEKGFIIEGEGRYLAQKDMGVKEIEVIKLTHLTEEQKVAYMLVHNKLTMNTGFDLDLLEEELSKISSIDMKEFEFDIKEIEEELEEEEKIQEPSFNYKEQYGVIVICKDETEQEKVYNNLLNQGYECKVVTT
jgi:ParB-like chromosome segregation protein Spo0J|nr:MAG TPA: ParB protein [Caudoviricetes sp.]